MGVENRAHLCAFDHFRSLAPWQPHCVHLGAGVALVPGCLIRRLLRPQARASEAQELWRELQEKPAFGKVAVTADLQAASLSAQLLLRDGGQPRQ